MNIWHLLFGFDGRISRKPYIVAIISMMLVMGVLMLAGAALVTGDALSFAFWGFRRGDIGVWGPIYAGVVLLTIWPTFALMAKRLHDRGYAIWVGLVFYLVMLTAGGAILWFGGPGLEAADNPSQRYGVLIATLLLWPVALWFTAQVMCIRGVPGPNAWGPDPLAGHPLPGYEPKTFWNVVFNPDGRIGRGTWWLMFVSLFVLFVIWGAIYGVALHSAMSSLPRSSDPAWLASPEGKQTFSHAILPVVIPLTLVLYLLLWPALAAGVKRLHDRGRSGWVLASYYVPFALLMTASLMQPVARGEAVPEGPARWLMSAAGLIFVALSLWLLVEFGFLKGQPGENAYGPEIGKA